MISILSAKNVSHHHTNYYLVFRKPSSWRHPGGTVSETEETDFSECEADAPGPDLKSERRKPGHVNSFTFSSLSMFRNKHNSGCSDTSGKKDGSRSPALISQLSIDSSIEEEHLDHHNLTTNNNSDNLGANNRSPNRKFKEATDKVGDKLLSYARKLKKDNREREKGRGELAGGRSASAGRNETIEEETFEDVEAERCGVMRAYSLNSKQIIKPILQSHSSTESTDVPNTPKSTPTRTKKKLSLKKSKSTDIDAHCQIPSKRSLRGTKYERKSECKEVTSDDSPPSLVLSCPVSNDPGRQLSPIGSPSSDFPFTFPEVFRQAIQEVDILTKKCAQETEIEVNEAGIMFVPGPGRAMSSLVADAGQEIMTQVTDKTSDETSVASDRGCLAFMSVVSHGQPEDSDQDTEDDQARPHQPLNLKSTAFVVKKLSPSQAAPAGAEQASGHRSRQGSKRRRKKETSGNHGKINSPPKLKLKIPTKEKFAPGPVSARSASYTSLRTSSAETEGRNFRTCLSSSPCPSASRDAVAGSDSTEIKSPQIVFTGSSTLPRSTSECKKMEMFGGDTTPVTNQASVLTLQLEGAFGCSMSVSEAGSREDTISPMTSQKTGKSLLESGSF